MGTPNAGGTHKRSADARTTKTGAANARRTAKPAGAESGGDSAPRPASAAGPAPAAESPSIKAISISVTSRHPEDRLASIAKAAYFRSELRGFEPGHEIEDWLAAEEEVDQRVSGEGPAS